MQGSILGYDPMNNVGYISGMDGNRYEFNNMAWKDQRQPYVGAPVDFETSGTSAMNIFMVSAQPGFGPGGMAMGPPRSRTAYIILAIFLGALGVHNFYAGYTGKAVAQLLISVLSLGFLAIVSWIWAVIECITVVTDANGRMME